jgi:hypothetical protein
MSKDDEGDAADVVYMKTSPYDKMVQALRKCESEGGEAICFMKTRLFIQAEFGPQRRRARRHCHKVLHCTFRIAEKRRDKARAKARAKANDMAILAQDALRRPGNIHHLTASVIFAMGVISLADSLGFINLSLTFSGYTERRRMAMGLSLRLFGGVMKKLFIVLIVSRYLQLQRCLRRARKSMNTCLPANTGPMLMAQWSASGKKKPAKGKS